MPKATRKQLDAAEKLLRANGYLTYELLERDKEEREVAAVYRQQARSEFHDEGTIEIDDLAPVSVSEDGGAYVMAWVWVRNDDDSEDEDEDGK